MGESMEKIALFFSPEKRKKLENQRAEQARKTEERERKHNAWVKETDEKFSQLSAEKLYTYRFGELAQRFRSTHEITRGLLTLDAVEQYIRNNAGQSDQDIYQWMNTVKSQVRSVNAAFYDQKISEEIKKEIEENVFSLYGSLQIFQIENILKEKYGIKILQGGFGSSPMSGNN